MKYQRIKKNKHFQRLFKRGKRIFSPSLTLLVFPSDKLQMGIALSKKHGKAVCRNRIKRLIRASFDSTCDALNGTYEIIVLPKVKEDKNDYTFADYEKCFKICFKKMNV